MPPKVFRRPSHWTPLSWAGLVALALAIGVQLTRTGIDLLLAAGICLVLLSLERTVGDWVGERLGPIFAGVMFATMGVALFWYFFFSTSGRIRMTRVFAAAEERGYRTAYFEGVPPERHRQEARAPSAGSSFPVGHTEPSRAPAAIDSTGPVSDRTTTEHEAARPKSGVSAAAPPAATRSMGSVGDRTITLRETARPKAGVSAAAPPAASGGRGPVGDRTVKGRETARPKAGVPAVAPPAATGGTGPAGVHSREPETVRPKAVAPLAATDSTPASDHAIKEPETARAKDGAPVVAPPAHDTPSASALGWLGITSNPGVQVATRTTLYLAPTRVLLGRRAALRASVTADGRPVGAGRVEFMINGIGGGVGQLAAAGTVETSFSTYIAGSYNVIARFTGARGFLPSASEPATLAVAGK
jgi:hypothetical protein